MRQLKNPLLKFRLYFFFILVNLYVSSYSADLNLSKAQLQIEGNGIVHEIYDSRALGECLDEKYKMELLNRFEKWEKIVKSKNMESKLLTTYKRLVTHTKEVKNKPVCKNANTIKEPLNLNNTKIIDNSSKFGVNTGEFSKNSVNTVMVGASSGRSIKNSDFATLIGYISGYELVHSPFSTIIGSSAAQNMKESPYSIAIGSSAGRFAKKAVSSIFLGESAGYGSKHTNYSVFLGYASGRWIKHNLYSIIEGYAAGEYADRSNHSVLIGSFSGYQAKNSKNTVMIGRGAGMFANNAPNDVFLGFDSGRLAKNTANSIFIGENSGRTAANTKDIILIGSSTTAEPGIHNAIGLGKNANLKKSNTLYIPKPISIGIGTAKPTAQLHTTGSIRFEKLKDGILIADKEGNIKTSEKLSVALNEIENLKLRINKLENLILKQNRSSHK